MIIEQILVGELDVFCYILGCDETKKGAIIDPGGDEDKIINLIHKLNLEILFIINTHFHYDHIQGNAKVQDATGAAIVMHAKDIMMTKDQSVVEFFKRPGIPSTIYSLGEPVRAVNHNDSLSIGKQTIKILHTPGHTPGGICLYTDGHLFTGDTLFVGAAGRVDLPGGNQNDLVDSIQKIIGALPESTTIWPGHNYGDSINSTVGREKRENPFFNTK